MMHVYLDYGGHVLNGSGSPKLCGFSECAVTAL